MATNWANLPADIIEEFTRYLTIQDIHRLGAVCKDWYAVTKLRRHSPAPQLPWIAFGEERHTQRHKFISLSELKHYCLDVPHIHEMTLCGSKYGWLFAVDKSLKVVLVNPLKGVCRELPSLPPYFNGHLVLKATINCDPEDNSQFTLVVLSNRGTVLFWETSKQVWSNVTGLPMFTEDIEFFQDILYIAGSTLLNECSVIHRIDLKLESTATQVGPILPVHDDFWEVMDKCHLVRHIAHFGGTFFLIVRLVNIAVGMRTKEMLIFILDMEANEFIETEVLDGCTVFLGSNSPVVVPKEFPGSKENTLLFASRKEIVSFDIATKTITPVYCDDSAQETALAAPLWFTPNQ